MPSISRSRALARSIEIVRAHVRRWNELPAGGFSGGRLEVEHPRVMARGREALAGRAGDTRVRMGGPTKSKTGLTLRVKRSRRTPADATECGTIALPGTV